jgi:hypothetical protein
MTLDPSDFLDGLRKLNREAKSRSVSEKAVFDALSALKLDADRISPKTPKRIGTLRSETEKDIKQIGDRVVGKITWTMPYAERLHEGDEDWNWSLGGSGPQYVRDKIKKFANKYINVAARVFRRFLR